MKQKKYEDIYKTFCDNVKRICFEKEIKQYELAEMLGIEPQFYNIKVNQRGAKFSLAQAVVIARRLNTTVDELIGDAV